MITPGSTWEIFHFEGQPKVVDLTGYQSNGGLFTFTAGVQYYAQITGTGVIGMGQQ